MYYVGKVNYLSIVYYHSGSIGGQLLNGAEGGGDNTSSTNVGNTICDNNTTNNNHANNRTVAGQNTPDGKEYSYILFAYWAT